MRSPLEAAEVGDQKFTSPDFAVSTVAGAIERDPDDFAGEMVLRHAACDVCMMMLHADLRLQRKPLRELGAHVLGMQIVSDGAWRDSEKLFQIGERLLEEQQRLVILQVADVLAEDAVASLGEAERVLEFGAAGENLLQLNP